MCSLNHNNVASSADPLPDTEKLTWSPNTPMMLTTPAYSISLLYMCTHIHVIRSDVMLFNWAHFGVKVTLMLVDCRGWVVPLGGATVKTPE